VAGAFPARPTDLDQLAGTLEPHPRGFDPVIMKRVPFPSIVIASHGDRRISMECARAFTTTRRCFLDVERLGHIGYAPKPGVWPRLVPFGQFIASVD